MSNDSTGPPHNDKVRWAITVPLLILAVPCIGWALWLKVSGQVAEEGGDVLFLPFAILDVLAVVVVGTWVLRPPRSVGTLASLARWLGRVLLFLGLAAATIIFLFGTCIAIAL
jgi:hypothetical protein